MPSQQEWRAEYIDLCSHRLSEFQIKLLEHGPQSLSQSWLLQAMHQDWKRIQGIPPDPEPPDCSSSLKEWEQSIKKYEDLPPRPEEEIYDTINDPYGGY